MDPTAKILFQYLRDLIYNPGRAQLDTTTLPEGFRDLGQGLQYLAECILETKSLASDLSKGDLDGKMPSQGNEIAAPLKSLHASLKHLTWQTQQVAQGDYQQRVEFMGHFAAAFNTMIQQLEERRRILFGEKSRLERYLNLLLSNCPDLILLFDQKGGLIFASDSYLRLGKASTPEIQGKSLRELLAPVVTAELLTRFEEWFRAALEDKHSSEAEQEIDFRRDGALRQYRIQMTPMLDEDGAGAGVMAFFIDTTESMRARLAAERARELAEQSARSKSDFLARMSHEMRTPMNAIIGMAAIARSAPNDERQDHYLDSISTAAYILLRMIDNVLAAADFENGTFSLSAQEFLLAERLRNLGMMMQRAAAEKKQQCSIALGPDLPERAVGDEPRLQQVLINLFSNAMKFTPEGGSVGLSASKIGEDDTAYTLCFVVSDTGIGMSAQQEKALWAFFEQGDNAITRQHDGAGVGIAVSSRIVRQMGGEIRVETGQGKGTRFICTVRVGKISQAETADAAIPATPPAPAFSGQRFLLTDDVPLNREIVMALLEDTGAQIDCAESGAEALAKFHARLGQYNLVLMDLHMPGMDGFEAARRLRASGEPGAETVPIIAVTADTRGEIVDLCLAAGMNAHIGKPLEADALRQIITQHLHGRGKTKLIN